MVQNTKLRQFVVIPNYSACCCHKIFLSTNSLKFPVFLMNFVREFFLALFFSSLSNCAVFQQSSYGRRIYAFE